MSELRHDPIHKRWVIVALERSKRPEEFRFAPPIPADDEPPCPFCPGQEGGTPPELLAVREGGVPNDSTWSVRVVPNRRPVLAIEGDLDRRAHGVYDRMRGIGAHEMVLESPDHRRRPHELPVLQFAAALGVSKARVADLMKDRRFKYALLHKNFGVAAGASIHHPMQQIVAMPVTPLRVSITLESGRAHFHLKERCLFCDVIEQEMEEGSRIVHVDNHFVSFCPYASRFPYETHTFPRRHQSQFTDLDATGLERLAGHMIEVFRRLHTVLKDPPFNWALINSPNPQAGGARAGFWSTLPHDFHWHLEALPRLTPQAGFEWGTGLFINPTAPEDAAAFLRDAAL
jgi:UDPglucose--hexose-1-phosphate uridylyltransferase